MLKKHQQPTGKDVDAVLDQIERVVRWSDEFRLAFVKCNHPVQREAMRRSLRERLNDKRVLEIFLEKPIISLLDELSTHWDAKQLPDAVCVYGLENSLSEQREASPVLGRLNHDRDLIHQAIPAALLIWLPDFALDYVARGAPDFWAWRSGVYEFPTEVVSWQRESSAVLARDSTSLFSLSLEDKQKEIARLEGFLRTVQTLPQRDKRVQQTNAHLWHQLGLLQESLYKLPEAIASHEKALKIKEELGDQDDVAWSLYQIAIIYRMRGEYPAALANHKRALKLFEALSNQDGVAWSLHQIGMIHQARGDYEEALANYERALKFFEASGYGQFGVAWSLHQIGTIHQARGDYEKALANYEQALKIKEELGDQDGVAWSLHQIGTIHQARGDYTRALANYEQALMIAERLGDQVMIANSHGQIGQLFIQTGNYKEAFEHLMLALRTLEKLQSPDVGIAVNTLKELRTHWGEQAFDAAWRKATGGAAL
jgi:tetratricopeptide (TPR) repeat protein